MVMRRGAVVALLFLSDSILTAQQPVERVRSGTASIAGHVTEAETKRPLGGVLVTLSAQDLRARLSTITTPDGRYLFEGIAPAPYVVEANHPDYVPARFVETEPQRVGNRYLWVTTATPNRTGVDLALIPAGKISGRITDQDGRPLKGAMVTLARTRDDQGPLTSTAALTVALGTRAIAQSSTTGHYTLGQVPEGSYRIRVTWTDPEAVKARTFTRPEPALPRHQLVGRSRRRLTPQG